MFLSALQTPIVVAIIIVVAVQYAFALFCLLKLAYLDISKREYVLWNLFILLVFFIGGIAFLVYYYKKGKAKRIPPYTPATAAEETGSEPPTDTAENDAHDKTEPMETESEKSAPTESDAPAPEDKTE